MILTYVIQTAMIHNARTVALRRAAAEGWSRVSVIAVKKIGFGAYEVTVTVSS